MGCSNSSSADELLTDKRVDNKNDNDKKSQKSENSNKKDNEGKGKGKDIEIDNKKNNVNKKQINIKKEACILSTEENSIIVIIN